MNRFHSLEGVEFEDQVGVTRSDHLVIHVFFGGSQMAGEAFFRAQPQIFSVEHAHRDGFLMRPITSSVRSKPL